MSWIIIIWPLLNKSNKRSCVTPTHPGNINKKEGEEGGTARKNRRRDRGIEVPFMLNDQNPAQILKKGQPEDIALEVAQKYGCSWFSFSIVRITTILKLIVNSRLQSYLSPVESSMFRWTGLQAGEGINSKMQFWKIVVESLFTLIKPVGLAAPGRFCSGFLARE